jgi:HEAT repeat protein
VFEPRRRGGSWWVVAIAAGVPALLFVGLALLCGGWLFRPGTTTRQPAASDPFAGVGPGVGAPAKTDRFPKLGGDLPGTAAKNRSTAASRRPLRGTVKGKPIAPGEFKEVLRTLQGKPSIETLRDLAQRLAATTPTDEQKRKREETRQQRALSRGGAGGNPAVLEQAELADDILQVSRALNPLLRDSNSANKKAAVLAMQKWGTEENVPDLMASIEGREVGRVETRVEAARALAAIGDERAVAVITRQVVTSQHDRSRGMASALVAFGAKAEAELRGYLKSKSFVERNAAIEVLKEVGTMASIPDLEELAKDKRDILSKKQARAAIDAINRREQK